MIYNIFALPSAMNDGAEKNTGCNAACKKQVNGDCITKRPEDFSNALVFSSYNTGINRIFEDYCNGIKANCRNYHYIDYIELYLKLGKSSFEGYIERYIATNHISVIFFIWWSCDLTFDIHFIERLSKKVAIVMNFYDTEYFFESVDRYYAQLANLVILPDWMMRYRYKRFDIPVHTSFSLFDSSHYRKISDTEKDIDVSFVGNVKNGDRAEYISYLRANGINVKAYGVGSEGGFLSFEEMVSVFNRSKINLNFTALANCKNYIVPIPSINQRIRQSKGRPIEVALCGGFVLTQYASGIEQIFKAGEEVDVFNSKEELLKKIRFYLLNDAERQKIAEKAYKRAITQYDAKAGFREIFDILQNLPPKPSFPTYVDDDFVRIYASARFTYIARYLLSGKFSHAWEELCTIAKCKKLSISMAYFFAVKGVVITLLARPNLYKKIKKIKDVMRIRVKY